MAAPRPSPGERAAPARAVTGSLFPGAQEAPPRPAPERPAPRPSAAPAAAQPVRGAFAEVALDRPLRCEFTYRVPPALEALARPGARVVVPFGPRREVGVIVGRSGEARLDPRRTRDVERVLDAEPVVDAALLELTRWMAARYACSWGEALAALLPAAMKRESARRVVLSIRAVQGIGAAELRELEERFEKQHRLLRTLVELGEPIELRELLGRLNLSDAPARSLERRGWVTIERVAVVRDPLDGPVPERVRPERLTEAQESAVRELCEPLAARRAAQFLLQGVTGSGKTEVYLRLIERALELGRGAIVLVPEIALTPQTVGWFRARFGAVAVLHSRMSDGQRLDAWTRLARGEIRVVVGARSAIFAPVPDLGVIVVDEEHEPSFKQGTAPRYHAREVALRRAELAHAVCVLGSATPSLESWSAARAGALTRLVLPARVAGQALPRVEVVDLRGEKAEGGGPVLFSARLRALLQRAHERGEQAILFQNRRGFAPVLWCRACSRTVSCAHCDVALTFHRRIGRAVCHTCCEESPPPRACPTCSAPALRFLGLGSERVEEALRELLPTARVARMDSDTMLRREDYERTLDAFGRGELDVLVGTQMIAKGLDFPRVTVVGVISADSALHLPDFRAAERTFQLLSQVAGRAGRGELAGEIVVQTQAPEHPAIRLAATHDFEAFAAREDLLRAELGYPPHGRLVRAVLEDEEEERVLAAGDELAAELRPLLAGTPLGLLGPAPAPLARVRGRHRRHLLLKSPPGAASGTALDAALEHLCAFSAQRARPRISIDVDPVSML